MNIYKLLPSVTAGFKLKRLSEKLRSSINQHLKSNGIDVELYTSLALMMIKEQQNTTTSNLSKSLGVTQPAATQIITQLSNKKLVTIKSSRQDNRVKWISLSPAGNTLCDSIAEELIKIDKVIKVIAESENIQFQSALNSLDLLIQNEGLNDYLSGKLNESEPAVQIIPFSPEFKRAFKKINKDWIERHLGLSDDDRKILNDPEKQILKKKGKIFLAKESKDVIGTVALQKIDKNTFEISKLAVKKKARGKGVGNALLEKCIQESKKKGVNKLILYSNSKLVNALNLYFKNGFALAENDCEDKKRCNVKLELILNGN